MPASNARRTPPRPPRKTPEGQTRIAAPAKAEVVRIIARRNPKARRDQIEAAGALVAEFSAAAATLTPEARDRLLAHRDLFRAMLHEALSLERAGQPPQTLAPTRREDSVGEGLGPLLSAAEGAARLGAYAAPARLEDWAGPVAGSTQLRRDLGVARSTLHAWQKQGAVVALQAGMRKHAFPLEQFVDGRPVTGLGAVAALAGDARTAWLWLRTRNPALDGQAPLARLKAGAADGVLQVARANFA